MTGSNERSQASGLRVSAPSAPSRHRLRCRQPFAPDGWTTITQPALRRSIPAGFPMDAFIGVSASSSERYLHPRLNYPLISQSRGPRRRMCHGLARMLGRTAQAVIGMERALLADSPAYLRDPRSSECRGRHESRGPSQSRIFDCGGDVNRGVCRRFRQRAFGQR